MDTQTLHVKEGFPEKHLSAKQLLRADERSGCPSRPDSGKLEEAVRQVSRAP